MAIIFGFMALTFTLFGGLFALKYRDKLHLILGFSAGAVIAVAFFELLPEALELAGDKYELATVTSVVALGFLIFMLLDRLFVNHSHCNDCENTSHQGNIRAGSLSLHSFLDGMAIGLAFQVSPSVGMVVTLGVLVHDFSDGINTVASVLRSGGSPKQALKWVFMDALAPVLGVLSTLFFSLPADTLGLILAVFCGFFLYIGASDLLPESHHQHPTHWTTFSTVVGLALIFFATQWAGF